MPNKFTSRKRKYIWKEGGEVKERRMTWVEAGKRGAEKRDGEEKEKGVREGVEGGGWA